MIECSQVEVTYPSEGGRNADSVVAVQGLDLVVEQGEFITMVGASGCGKTTFLYALDGLVDRSRGAIRVDGQTVHGPGPDRAVVFQSFGLLAWRTVTENIALGLEAQGWKRKDRLRLAKDLAARVGLAEFENAYPGQLSGGMQQRVGLARALAVDPKVLLMDEPFGALDAQTRDLMCEELLSIWDASQMTVLFVTHDIDEAVYLADRVVVLSARPGRVKEVIPVDLPRPRPLSVKASPAFVETRARIWQLLEEEVRGGSRAAT